MGTLQGGFAGRDLALSPDGAHVYGASGSPYYCTDTDTTTGPTTALGPNRPYPGNVAIAPDARIYCGRYATLSSEKDVYAFSAAGTELGSVRVAGASSILGLLDRQLVVSGDGLRVVGLSDDPGLRIVTAP